jgi:hypothetical protein
VTRPLTGDVSPALGLGGKVASVGPFQIVCGPVRRAARAALLLAPRRLNVAHRLQARPWIPVATALLIEVP